MLRICALFSTLKVPLFAHGSRSGRSIYYGSGRYQNTAIITEKIETKIEDQETRFSISLSKKLTKKTEKEGLDLDEPQCKTLKNGDAIQFYIKVSQSCPLV